MKNGQGNKTSVHKAVIAAFVGPVPNGLQINHIDGIKTNNHASNLEYVTLRENIQHGWDSGLMTQIGESSVRAKLKSDDVKNIRAEYAQGDRSQQDIADEYGVDRSNIGLIVRGESWRHLLALAEGGAP